MNPEPAGYRLPLLLAASFRRLVGDLHAELADRGHPHARPVHGFALQAIGPEGISVSELGRRLGVSKQAAAKTARGLESLGYVVRQPDPTDGRAVRLARSDLGTEMLALSAKVFDRLRAELAERIGRDEVGSLEAALEQVAGEGAPMLDLPGWMA